LEALQIHLQRGARRETNIDFVKFRPPKSASAGEYLLLLQFAICIVRVGVRLSGIMTVIADWPHAPKFLGRR
jgi:hypothetical protein